MCHPFRKTYIVLYPGVYEKVTGLGYSQNENNLFSLIDEYENQRTEIGNTENRKRERSDENGRRCMMTG